MVLEERKKIKAEQLRAEARQGGSPMKTSQSPQIAPNRQFLNNSSSL
jgi:hypothetical protein